MSNIGNKRKHFTTYVVVFGRACGAASTTLLGEENTKNIGLLTGLLVGLLAC